MNMTLARYIDTLGERRIEARATEIATRSQMVAAIMRAAVAIAAGEPAEAGRRIIDTICSIDGGTVDQKMLDAAVTALRPLLKATADAHTCQACMVRSLAGLVGRITLGIRPERIGEILGGLHIHAAELIKTQEAQRIAA